VDFSEMAADVQLFFVGENALILSGANGITFHNSTTRGG
jgi:hypothetical protein